jgi:hypothetical protein
LKFWLFINKRAKRAVLKQQRKKAADSSGFEDNYSKGRADEKRRGKVERCAGTQLSFED